EPRVRHTSDAKADIPLPPLSANSRHCLDSIRLPSLVGRTAWRTSRLARLTLCRSWAEVCCCCWSLCANRSHTSAMWDRVARALRSLNLRAISRHCCARRRYSSALLATAYPVCPQKLELERVHRIRLLAHRTGHRRSDKMAESAKRAESLSPSSTWRIILSPSSTWRIIWRASFLRMRSLSLNSAGRKSHARSNALVMTI